MRRLCAAWLSLMVFQVHLSQALRAYVITLDRQIPQYDKFIAKWAPLWPAAEFIKFNATESPIRGKGICASIIRALETADVNERNAPILIFEPDALPFSGVDYSIYDWTSLADYDIYFLGGHNIHLHTPPKEIAVGNEIAWIPVTALSGCYGFLVTARHRVAMIQKMHQYCDTPRRGYSVDIFLSHCINSAIATPLLVDHPRSGWSETHKLFRQDAWAGQRNWPSLPRFNYEKTECT